jgi:hypothetical protein
LSLRCQGVSVKIYDKSNNLLKDFPTMSNAAKYLGVSFKTISNIFKTGISYDDLIYKFSIKDTRILILNSKFELLNVLDNAKKTGIFYNIPKSTLSDYIKLGKLYKNKYYFLKAYSKNITFKNNINGLESYGETPLSGRGDSMFKS